MGLVVDQAHLTDIVPRLQGGEDHLAPPGIGCQHPRPPGQDDVQRIGLQPLLDNTVAALEAALDHGIRNLLCLALGQQRKQRNPPQQVGVRQH